MMFRQQYDLVSKNSIVRFLSSRLQNPNAMDLFAVPGFKPQRLLTQCPAEEERQQKLGPHPLLYTYESVRAQAESDKQLLMALMVKQLWRAMRKYIE